jgi:hypothetical protein
MGLSIIGTRKLAFFDPKGKPVKINLVNDKREVKPHNANEQLHKLSQMLLQDI